MGQYANFYNSVNGDRKYDADSFAEWLRPFFTTGVFNGELQVTGGNGDMSINVAPGNANINGKMKNFEVAKTLTLDLADASLPRIDNIVIRRDDANRDFYIMVQKGSYGETPTAPSPVRENEIYDLVIAQVLVAPATIAITQSAITDTRMDNDLCGWVTGTVEEISFDQIVAQWQAYMSEFEEENLNAFNTWFNSIKSSIESILNNNSVINDSQSSVTTTYSSSKIDTKLNDKLDKNVQFVDEGDFNDLIVVGKTTISVLRTFGSALNAPIANIPGVYTVISNCSAVNGGTQLAIESSTNRIFTRTYLGGNDWRNWVEYVSKKAFVLEGTTLKITM